MIVFVLYMDFCVLQIVQWCPAAAVREAPGKGETAFWPQRWRWASGVWADSWLVVLQVPSRLKEALRTAKDSLEKRLREEQRMVGLVRVHLLAGLHLHSTCCDIWLDFYFIVILFQSLLLKLIVLLNVNIFQTKWLKGNSKCNSQMDICLQTPPESLWHKNIF